MDSKAEQIRQCLSFIDALLSRWRPFTCQEERLAFNKSFYGDNNEHQMTIIQFTVNLVKGATPDWAEGKKKLLQQLEKARQYFEINPIEAEGELDPSVQKEIRTLASQYEFIDSNIREFNTNFLEHQKSRKTPADVKVALVKMTKVVEQENSLLEDFLAQKDSPMGVQHNNENGPPLKRSALAELDRTEKCLRGAIAKLSAEVDKECALLSNYLTQKKKLAILEKKTTPKA